MVNIHLCACFLFCFVYKTFYRQAANFISITFSSIALHIMHSLVLWFNASYFFFIIFISERETGFLRAKMSTASSLQWSKCTKRKKSTERITKNWMLSFALLQTTTTATATSVIVQSIGQSILCCLLIGCFHFALVLLFLMQCVGLRAPGIQLAICYSGPNSRRKYKTKQK